MKNVTQAALKTLSVIKYLKINNCIEMGTENACVMIAISNGVYFKLEQENSSLMLMRSGCHSMQLAMSYAPAEFLPMKWEYLIAKTYNLFA